MIDDDALDNEVGVAFARLLVDRGATDEEAIQIVAKSEWEDWFWAHVRSMTDRLLYYSDIPDARKEVLK